MCQHTHTHVGRSTMSAHETTTDVQLPQRNKHCCTATTWTAPKHCCSVLSAGLGWQTVQHSCEA